MRQRARSLTALILVLAFWGPLTAQQPNQPSTYRLSLPGRNWSLDFVIEDLEDFDESLSDNGYVTFLTGVHDKKRPRHVRLVSIDLKQSKSPGNASAFREFVKKRLSKLGSSISIKVLEHNSIPVLRYSADLLAQFRNDGFSGQLPGGPLGYPIDGQSFRTLEAYFVNDETWISVRLTCPEIDKKDEDFFYSLIDSIRFVDTSKAVSSFDYYHRGKPLYAQHKLKEAIEPFATAFALEQQTPSLDGLHFRQLIRELADAYGSQGRAADYKSVLDYGLVREPSYYLFHLGVARYYGSQGDLDNTLIALGKAFANQVKPSNSIDRSVRFLDPLTDPDFARFKNNEKFRKTVKEMQDNWTRKK